MLFKKKQQKFNNQKGHCAYKTINLWSFPSPSMHNKESVSLLYSYDGIFINQSIKYHTVAMNSNTNAFISLKQFTNMH